MSSSSPPSPLTPFPDPMLAPICAYDLEIIGDGQWTVGYMYQPGNEDHSPQHMSFAARRDTGEMFTLENLGGGLGTEPDYFYFPMELHEQVPSHIVDVMRVIADSSRALDMGALPAPMLITAVMGNEHVWNIGLEPCPEHGARAYVEGPEGQHTMVRPLMEIDDQLHDPETSFNHGMVPEQVYNLLYVASSIAAYRQLAERLQEQKQHHTQEQPQSSHVVRLEQRLSVEQRQAGEHGR